MATDQELNEYMGVKKYAPYRKEARWDPKRVDRLKAFKEKISERASVAGIGQGSGTADKSTKKRKGKKERLKLRAGAADEDREVASDPSNLGGSGALKRKQESGDVDGLVGNAQETAHHGKKRRRKKEPQGDKDSLRL